MFNDLTGFIIFTIVTTFTPGPNNISALTFSLNVGYRRTLPYIIGIICGVFTVQIAMATALLGVSSSSIAEAIEWLKYIGAAYIIFLAYKSLKMNIEWGEESATASAPHFGYGFILQSINPKLYLFTITLLSTFVDYSRASYLSLIALCAAMSTLTFVAVSTWAAAGALIKELLQKRTYRLIFSAVMSLALIFTAYRILL